MKNRPSFLVQGVALHYCYKAFSLLLLFPIAKKAGILLCAGFGSY
jgi:hypothetical protein